MFYIGGFIMKTRKENIKPKRFKKLKWYRYILKKKEVSFGLLPERKD